jgi:hypothetical protein
MRNGNRRDLPSKVAIRKYWAARLVQLGKFDCETEIMEADYCFACGLYWPEELGKPNTERAHITARIKGGTDEASNIHNLCRCCHTDSEYIDGETYWRWFKSRTPADAVASMAQRAGMNFTDILTMAQADGRESGARRARRLNLDDAASTEQADVRESGAGGPAVGGHDRHHG